ncbi:MAG: DMT family transporter [Clostridiaceae bacterium]|nr:DMT family transporter [Clostridiaceae bacterium]
MKMTTRTANLMLLLISILWGSGFIATKVVLDANVTAGFINLIRGSIFSVLTLLFFRKKIFKMTVKDFKVGLIAGLLNFGGFITQTTGMKYTTPSNSAFITSIYVVIIPIIAWLLYKKPLEFKSFISIALCLLGTAILTGITTEKLNINIGDLYTLVCAFFYASSIAYISYGAKKTDFSVVAFILATVQAIGGLGHFIIFDGGRLTGVNWQISIFPLLYMGVVCSFIAQTIQVFAQRHTSATAAGLIMMLEGFFGSVFSVAFGFEPFTSRLAIGGTIIMISLVLIEVDFIQLKKWLTKDSRITRNDDGIITKDSTL